MWQPKVSSRTYQRLLSNILSCRTLLDDQCVSCSDCLLTCSVTIDNQGTGVVSVGHISRCHSVTGTSLAHRAHGALAHGGGAVDAAGDQQFLAGLRQARLLARRIVDVVDAPLDGLVDLLQQAGRSAARTSLVLPVGERDAQQGWHT